MNTARILIACIGNIRFGDDAFGVEVARRFAGRPIAERVSVVDIGIRGLDLTLRPAGPRRGGPPRGTVPRCGPPGTLYVLEPEIDPAGAVAPGAMAETHALDPVNVIRIARSLGGNIERILPVSCEPRPPSEDDNLQMEMSEPVRVAVEEAIHLVESLVTKMLTDGSR